jgi:hypothetical protein
VVSDRVSTPCAIASRRIRARWCQRDQDPERLLPVLSAYLGHVYVADTQWYLNGSPELMREAMRRLEHCWEGRT